MNSLKLLITSMILLVLFLIPTHLHASSMSKTWTSGPWQPQNMISWGDQALIVDFGLNGLWNYNGSWIRLSRWNPESMVVWGTNLTVDFGGNGLWNYNGSIWIKLADGES